MAIAQFDSSRLGTSRTCGSGLTLLAPLRWGSGRPIDILVERTAVTKEINHSKKRELLAE